MLGYNQWCPKCKSGKGIVKLTIPYAAKLLIQEVSLFLLFLCLPAQEKIRWERKDGHDIFERWADEQLMGMNIMPKLCLEDTV